MKRKNLEILVLVLGIAIIGTALFFMLVKDKTANTIFVTNIVFSVGFLIYILYSMMTTNSLNSEIRQLRLHVKSLKEEIEKRDKTISEKDARIANLNQDKKALEEKIANQQEEYAKLEERFRLMEETHRLKDEE